MSVLIVIVVIIIVVAFLVWRFQGGKSRFPWFEFYSKGRKEGFSLREIGFLKDIAIQNKLEKPQSIFWSTKQLDRCLKPAIQKINADEEMAPEYKLEMISKLLDLRTKAEFNLPRYKKKIRDTTTLMPRQKLLVRDKDYGSFVAWVIEINRRNIVVSQPSGQKGWETLNWASRKIEAYFWRPDDAGYVFETKVLEQITHEEYPLLYLAHSSSLSRIQKRKQIRVETSIRAQFSPIQISKVEGVNKAFMSRKFYMGKILDLSSSGCCVLAGSMLKKNDRLKIEFDLTPEKHVAAFAVIVNLSNTGDERVKKYHAMFVKIGKESMNNILLYVYNIFGEREETREKKPLAKTPQQKVDATT